MQPQPRIIYVWPQPLLTDGFGSWAKKRGEKLSILGWKTENAHRALPEADYFVIGFVFAWNQNGGSTIKHSGVVTRGDGFFLVLRSLTALKKPLR